MALQLWKILQVTYPSLHLSRRPNSLDRTLISAVSVLPRYCWSFSQVELRERRRNCGYNAKTTDTMPYLSRSVFGNMCCASRVKALGGLCTDNSKPGWSTKLVGARTTSGFDIFQSRYSSVDSRTTTSVRRPSWHHIISNENEWIYNVMMEIHWINA